MVEDLSKPIALVGLPGSGKSRVGRALSHRLNAFHVDTDEVVSQNAGKSIPEIFAQDGEDAFRRLELEAVRESLRPGTVVSLGGGAIETPGVREALEAATVIYIEADPAELLRRVSRNKKRPLLRKDPEGTLAELESRRVPWFRSAADIVVQTSASPIAGVLEQALAALEGLHVTEVAASPSYPVVVGWKCTDTALQKFPVEAKKALLVAAPSLEEQARSLEKALEVAGTETHVYFLPDGEAAKTLHTAEDLWRVAGELKLDRKDMVITLGGGATTDLGGFIAATWLRGIRVAHFPTSLLAMVDAAIGGKTGINSAAGKNLIGAFHNPQLVVVDLAQLRTLSQKEYTAGLAEIIKAGYIADPLILDIFENNPMLGQIDWATGPGRTVLQEVVERAIRVKARVVAEDFKEAGLREMLNYGHTLAHAVEKQTEFRVRHGEAVAIGMVLAAQLAADRDLIPQDLVERHRLALSSVGLPISFDGDGDALADLMYTDKKSRAGELRFVLLDDVGHARTEAVTREEVLFAYNRAVKERGLSD